ncbi:hypothetical protein EVAR_69086_1 [Eumeta japonica]|uniref:Uncharacterized protein n=1 Tax=Eumeta variegata TaxID=151549 RepID=A0A4C1ZDA5_EUMVA|nr:hypothetical protein EVAR_69086_1 [Eumeta japonica]
MDPTRAVVFQLLPVPRRSPRNPPQGKSRAVNTPVCCPATYERPRYLPSNVSARSAEVYFQRIVDWRAFLSFIVSIKGLNKKAISNTNLYSYKSVDPVGVCTDIGASVYFPLHRLKSLGLSRTGLVWAEGCWPPRYRRHDDGGTGDLYVFSKRHGTSAVNRAVPPVPRHRAWPNINEAVVFGSVAEGRLRSDALTGHSTRSRASVSRSLKAALGLPAYFSCRWRRWRPVVTVAPACITVTHRATGRRLLSSSGDPRSQFVGVRCATGGLSQRSSTGAGRVPAILQPGSHQDIVAKSPDTKYLRLKWINETATPSEPHEHASLECESERPIRLLVRIGLGKRSPARRPGRMHCGFDSTVVGSDDESDPPPTRGTPVVPRVFQIPHPTVLPGSEQKAVRKRLKTS